MAENAALKAAIPLAFFRCDASCTIGGGHLSRCLALAEALAAAGWRVAFAVGPDTAAMMPTVADFPLLKLSGTSKNEPTAMRAYYPDGVDLLVVDHYQRGVDFEKACRGWARQILVMDDATGRRHDCDFLLDAAAHGRVYHGMVPVQAQLLLGPTYALVRRSFSARRTESLRRRDGRAVTNILVSFGAADPLNLTATTLDVLDPFADDISIMVALSSRAAHVNEVRRKLHGRMQLKLDADMAVLMSEADLAVGAAGTSSYERAVLGLPSVAVIVAVNQRNLAQLIGSVGAALIIDGINSRLRTHIESSVRAVMDSDEKRFQMAQAAASLIDGRASERVVKFVVTEVECA
jgi:UDP-2,4-diacetamido-2,4,6-trideoxy-beta-L-altropyranose hydrolase